MRIKIIAVNALIVAVVGLLSFLVVRSMLTAATTNYNQLSVDAKRDVEGAAASLQLDGLRAERWLTARATEPQTSEALTKGTDTARADASTKRSDDVATLAKRDTLFEGTVPSLVVLIDKDGKSVGRNGTNLERRYDLASQYPGLKKTIDTGQSGSDVWVGKENYLASYVAVHDEKGQIVGALAVGCPLNDTLTHTSEATTGSVLAIVVSTADKGPDVVAHSAAQTQGIASATLDEAVKGGAKDAITTAFSHPDVAKVEGDVLVAGAPLSAFGDGKHVVIVSAEPASLLESPASIPLPIIWISILGIILVVIAGWLLASYITRPIQTLEEGLLAILNGQSDKRFELEHAELGGLAFRIDQLLNQLMGVEEDTTDAEGRPSRAPSAQNFSDAMAVGEDRGGGEGHVDPATVARLAQESPQQYYARIYAEYINAKRALGEQVDHITESAFATRIQGMEQEALQKHGKPVRYVVQARNKEVVLLPVPLA